MASREHAPAHCPNGHRLGPDQVVVGWMACGCTHNGGHRTYECRTCGTILYVPGHVGVIDFGDRWQNKL
ncbi:hypothetical protein [Prescottella agglutinans]|uniref:Uncharacterized protein n=1 Tax=Prescottella agglutinans TaxID=1644129 RepID=A0ABT6MEN4_9NOCA|nr:hypothetical protein [Prescottella agglutinans]MDH6282783.1 hypothetical protein [Prescottella agglutinans]